jgi:hypothetical protein
MGAKIEPVKSAARAAAIPVWIGVAVILGAVLMAAGSVIAMARPEMLVAPLGGIDGAARIYAGYFAVRNLALALVLGGLLALRARRALGAMMALTSLTQLLDAGMDCFEGRWMIVPGVTVFGVVFLVAAGWLCGAPIWKRAAWSDLPE